MITNFKIFEDMSLPLYDVGDYIKLKQRNKHPIGEIINTGDDDYTYSYHIEFISLNKPKIISLWFQENTLERLATPEEIILFKSEKASIKYNI